jgi:hypothetical protein
MRLKLILLKLLACAPVFAQEADEESVFSAEDFDYSAGFGLRTLPFGSSLYGRGGYNILLWGGPKSEGFLYGYARPALQLQSSAVVNRVDLTLDLYPISFFGFRLGKAVSLRWTDTSTLDCNVLECRGDLSRAYIQMEVLGAYQKYFGGLWARLDTLEPSRKGRNFADETSALAGRNPSDGLWTWEVLGGYDAESWKAGLWLVFQGMSHSRARNDTEYAFVTVKRGDFDYTVAAGSYASSTRSRGPAFAISVKWNGREGLSL